MSRLKTMGGLALGLMVAAAPLVGAGPVQAKELAFSVFVPAASPTVSKIYQPWVDWFNAQTEADGVTIKLFAGGTLGRNPLAQAKMVADGVADLALTVPSYTPGVYPDFDMFELPGFATTVEEGSLAVLEMFKAGQLTGYEDYYMAAIYTSGPYMLHTSAPLADFDGIAGRKFRVAGQIQTAVVQALGGVPQAMSALEMAENIDRGLLDGAVADASVAKTFKVSEVAKNHYAANLGVLVFAIVMNKEVYEGLPDGVKAVLEDSGQFIAERQVEVYGAAIDANMDAWTADPEHTVVVPSESDRARIAEAVAPVVDEVAANASPGLLDGYRAKLADIRAR